MIPSASKRGSTANIHQLPDNVARVPPLADPLCVRTLHYVTLKLLDTEPPPFITGNARRRTSSFVPSITASTNSLGALTAALMILQASGLV